MHDFVHDFHFLRPWWLLLLALLPLAVTAVWMAMRGRGHLARLADPVLLAALTGNESPPRRWALAVLVPAWVLAGLALAGPAWQRIDTPLYANQGARVVTLSLSRNMLAQDVQPDRLTRARYKVHDLLEHGGDVRNALIAYSGAAFVAAPLTDDADTVLNLLDALGPDVMPVDGDATGQAIDMAVRLLQQAGRHAGEIIVVASEVGANGDEAARRARAAGMRVSVLGIGTATGGPVKQSGGGFAADAGGAIRMARRDDAALRALAVAGGGRYAPFSADDADVATLESQTPLDMGVKRGDRNRQASRWRDFGPWLLLLLVPLAALAFRRGWVLLLPLVLLAHAAPTRASGLQGLWQTPDQRAASALAKGQAAQAAKLARDPMLRGTAAYRAGEYDQAERDFAQAQGAQAQYNRGNALARQERYRDALDAYAQALKLDPGLADARANQAAVKRWLKRQQHKPSSSGRGQQRSQDSARDGNKSPQQASKQPGRNSPAHAGESNPSGQADKGGDSQGNPQSRASAAPQGGQQGRRKTQADQGPNADESARQRRQARKANKAVKRVMDKALKGDQKTAPVHQLGMDNTNGQGKRLPGAMQRALQRVPDDPGGLLRRKFMLEYQRRQEHGGDPAQGGGP